MAVVKPSARTRRTGLASWMEQVLACHATAARAPDVRAVHQLRKALRRCRTLAGGLREADPAPEWRAMLKASRTLFRALGGLRDTHVLGQWLARLAPADDAAGSNLRYRLNQREVDLTAQARTALDAFDRAAWKRSIVPLAARAARHPPGDPLLEQLAMRRLLAVHACHRRALRDDSSTAWHALRIAIKRLRYACENFLPDLHRRWGGDLGRLQELLGEVHDLDLLWAEFRGARLLADAAPRRAWRQRLDAERSARLAAYRALMTGRDARWRAWRAELLAPDRVAAANRAALVHWGTRHGSDPARAAWLAARFEQVLDALASGPAPPACAAARRPGVAAALLHGLAAADGKRPSRRQVVRRLERLPLPIGWDEPARDACAKVLAGLGRRRLGGAGVAAEVRVAARLLDLLAALAPAGHPLPDLVIEATADGLALRVTPAVAVGELPRRRLAAALGVPVSVSPG
jgi:CHAD domain-containing protein